jgi:hypothetical protein
LDAGPCLRLLKCLGCVLVFSSGKIGLRVRKASANLRACRGARVCGFCRPIITAMRACLLEGWGWLDAGPCLRQLPSSNSLGACLSSGKVGLRVRKAIANLRACRGARICSYCRPIITSMRACRLEGRGWLDVGPCLRKLPSSNALGACLSSGKDIRNVLLRGPLHDDRFIRFLACWLRAFDCDECDYFIPFVSMPVCPCLEKDVRPSYAFPRRICAHAGGPASAASAAL